MNFGNLNKIKNQKRFWFMDIFTEVLYKHEMKHERRGPFTGFFFLWDMLFKKKNSIIFMNIEILTLWLCRLFFCHITNIEIFTVVVTSIMILILKPVLRVCVSLLVKSYMRSYY